MEVTLTIKGKKKKFKMGKVSVRLYRETVTLLHEFKNGTFMPDNYESDDIDKAVDYIVTVFSNQFTSDEFLDGFELYDAVEFMQLLNQCMDNVLFNKGRVEVSEKKA